MTAEKWHLVLNTQVHTLTRTHTQGYIQSQESTDIKQHAVFLYESNSKHINTMRTVYMISIELNLPVHELPDEHRQPNMRDPVEQE